MPKNAIVKTIKSAYRETFEDEAEGLMVIGYKMISAGYCSGDYTGKNGFWWAVMVKEDEKEDVSK